MEIRADEISRIIKQQIQSYGKSLDVAETGTVLSAGDGIARVYGLSGAMAGELLEFPGNLKGLVLNLEEDNVGVALMGDFSKIREGDTVRRTGSIAEVPVGMEMVGRVVDALGQAIDGRGPIVAKEKRKIEIKAPGIVARKSVHEPLRTRPQGHRRHDSGRPGTARADHRRSPDRQDHRGGDRHHPEPEGAGGLLHLRRDRSEAVDGGTGRRSAPEGGGDGVLDRRGRQRLRSGPAPVSRPLHRGDNRRVLPRQQDACPDHLRRSLQACRRLPPALAALAASARSRGLPRRRLLSPPPLAGAGRQALG